MVSQINLNSPRTQSFVAEMNKRANGKYIINYLKVSGGRRDPFLQQLNQANSLGYFKDPNTVSNIMKVYDSCFSQMGQPARQVGQPTRQEDQKMAVRLIQQFSASDTIFTKADLNYTGYNEEDKSKLEFAENCCAFPKLALAAHKKTDKDMNTVCKNLNAYLLTKNDVKTVDLKDFVSWLKQQK